MRISQYEGLGGEINANNKLIIWQSIFYLVLIYLSDMWLYICETKHKFEPLGFFLICENITKWGWG